MMPQADRLRSAQEIARHPAMRVTDLETELGTVYTAETLRLIARRYRRHQFVWLMGADNLIEIPRWKDWSKIFEIVPIAVFARPSYSASALAGVAAERFARRRLSESRARLVPRRRAPAWAFVHCPLHAASATAIRAGLAASTQTATPAEQ